MPDDLDERLRAVERALTDGETPVTDLSDAAAVHARLDDLDAELADLAERVDALDATVQSLHGYVGELEAVNDRVERRADAARAAVERLEDERSNRSTGATEHHTSPGPGNGSARRDRENAPDDAESTVSPGDAGARHGDGADQLPNALGDGDDTRNAGRAGSALHETECESEGEHEGEGSGSLLDRVRESL